MAVAVGLDAYAVPKKDGYKLVWKDNFDGSALNRDYWNVEVNGSGCGNNELQYYVDNADNVAVRDGNLVITARRQDYDGHAFTSGRVNTCGKVGFTYGIVEARIKLPKTANGLWPAFWMMGDDIKKMAGMRRDRCARDGTCRWHHGRNAGTLVQRRAPLGCQHRHALSAGGCRKASVEPPGRRVSHIYCCVDSDTDRNVCRQRRQALSVGGDRQEQRQARLLQQGQLPVVQPRRRRRFPKHPQCR